MEGSPYIEMLKIMKKTSPKTPTPFRLGKVRSVDPLKIDVGGNICDDEISGVAGGLELEKGARVLLANVDGQDNDYIVICEVK